MERKELKVVPPEGYEIDKDSLKINKLYTVYTHTSPSGKVYVGITSQLVKARWKYGHGYKRCYVFYSAILKYGWNNIEHKIILENISESHAKYTEKYLIKWYKIHKISYNITDGGEGGNGRVMTEELKQYLRKIHLGKTISEETREKLKLSHLGHKDSEETKRRKSEARKNRKLSEKQLLILKDTREKPKSEDVKEKIRKTLQQSSPRNKAVLQYTLNGKFIAEYISAAEASRITGCDSSSIRKVCKGKLKTCKNFIWKEKN